MDNRNDDIMDGYDGNIWSCYGSGGSGYNSSILNPNDMERYNESTLNHRNSNITPVSDGNLSCFNDNMYGRSDNIHRFNENDFIDDQLNHIGLMFQPTINPMMAMMIMSNIAATRPGTSSDNNDDSRRRDDDHAHKRRR